MGLVAIALTALAVHVPPARAQATGAPLVRATAHYVSPKPGSDLRPPAYAENRNAYALRRAPGAQRAPAYAPVAGTRKYPTILVEYSDQAHQVDQDDFRKLMYSTGEVVTGSVREYYASQSYGLFTFDGEVVGAQWYTSTMTRAEAAADVWALIADAVALADPDVDFSDFDNDGDGEVDVLFVAHSGPGQETTGDPDDIWSHMSAVWPPINTTDGVTVSRYTIEPEYDYVVGDASIGVFAHEGGHGIFGFPDFYDYGYDSAGTGSFDLMAGGSWNGGGARPAPMTAWEKVYAGWATPTLAPGTDDAYTLRAASSFPDIVRMQAAPGASNQYILIENRQGVTTYDQAMPGTGLFIWHVDDDVYGNDSQWYPGLSEANHCQVALEQADGNWDLEHNDNDGDVNDPFEASGTFTAYTTPDSRGYQQAAALQAVTAINNGPGGGMNVNVTNITNLTPSTLSVLPDPSVLGAQVTATATVHNGGSRDAGHFSVAFWKNRATNPTDGTGADNTWVVDLVQAGSDSADLAYAFTPGAAGSYTAYAMVDAWNVVCEPTEGDNIATDPYEVRATDVAATVSVVPDSSTLGTRLTAQVVGSNTGVADVGAFQIAFWQDHTGAPTDATGADKTWNIAGLAVGVDTGTLTHSFTPSQRGAFRAWVLADASNVLDEGNEANNAASDPYTVIAPDLTVTVNVTPNPANLGATLTAEVKAQNVGDEDAGAFQLAFWENQTTPPTNGAHADVSWNVAGLAAGQETAAFTHVFTPTGVGARTAYAMADTANTVGESDETNNVAVDAYNVETRSVSGTILQAGAGLAGVTVTVGTESATTAVDGTYTVNGLSAGTHTVTPTLANHGFVPATQQVTITPSGGNVTGVDFTAYPMFTKAFPTPGLAFVSMPGNPIDQTAADVFGIPGLVAKEWNLAAGVYANVQGALERAVGYWVRIPNGGATATVTGPVVSGDTLTITLAEGWNAVGNPFADNVDWSATRVLLSGTAVSLADAVDAGAIASYAWVYSPDTGYVLVHNRVPTALKEIAPWDGFFILAYQACGLQLHRAAAASASSSDAPAQVEAMQGPGFVFRVQARSASGADTFNVVGVASPSDPLVTATQILEPPRAGTGVSLSLMREGSTQPYAVDIRSDGSDSWEWDVVVSSDVRGEQVFVECPDLRSLPRQYSAFITDQHTGRAVYLRTSTGTVFVSDRDGAPRHFALTVQRRSLGLRITALTAEGAQRGGGSVSFILSAPAHITMTVLNAAGRVVGELATDAQASSGPQTLQWNGRSLVGTQVPSGLYTIRLAAESETGERTTATTHLELGR